MTEPPACKPFEGRTVLVTGSGRNIGRAIALAFARGGTDVVDGHRDENAIERVAEDVRELGTGALAILADVGDAAGRSTSRWI